MDIYTAVSSLARSIAFPFRLKRWLDEKLRVFQEGREAIYNIYWKDEPRSEYQEQLRAMKDDWFVGRVMGGRRFLYDSYNLIRKIERERHEFE